MERRTFLGTFGFGGAVLALIVFECAGNLGGGWLDDPDRRVRFICCDSHGDFGSVVYLRCGGGRTAFTTVREAAPFLRPGDVGASTAGLCGFLWKQADYDGDTGGTMSVEPPPQPGPDGKVDWEAVGGDGDIIIINVETAKATYRFGHMIGEEIENLPLGRPRTKRP